jgi:hypothetical protein
MSLRFNPFKKFKKAIKKETTPGKHLAEKILKANVEDRDTIVQEVKRSADGPERLEQTLQYLRSAKNGIESNLGNIKHFYIVQTLFHIYGFSKEDAMSWASVPSKQQLVDKLPDLPEVNFRHDTNPADIEKLKSTFKQRVKQVDDINRLLPQYEHAINTILQAAPHLAKTRQHEEKNEEPAHNTTPTLH